MKAPATAALNESNGLMYRPSRYIEVFDDGPSITCIHLVTGAVVRLPDRRHLAPEVLDGDPALAGRLSELGVVTADVEAEQRAVRRYARALYHAQARPTVVVAPTFQCNLDCRYCYQADIRRASRGFLTPAQIQLIIGFLARHEQPSLTLFGGEPLLRRSRDVLVPLLDHVRAAGGRIHAVTNATQLGAYTDYLGPDCIASAQVTVDGQKDSHDRYRAYAGGRGSWDDVIKGIDLLIAQGCRVNVRMNANRETVASCRALREQLTSRYDGAAGRRLSCYIANIYGDDGDIALDDCVEDVYNPATLPLVQAISGQGRFQPKGAHCGTSAAKGMAVFGPDGVWSCWKYVGRAERAVADYDTLARDPERFDRQICLADPPQLREPCQSCRYLLVCAGNCVTGNGDQPATCDAAHAGQVYRESLRQALARRADAR